MKQPKINGVVSKWFEALWGTSHNEPLTEWGSKWTQLLHPRLFLTFSDVSQTKGYTLGGIFTYTEASLPKPNTGTRGLRKKFGTLSGWDR